MRVKTAIVAALVYAAAALGAWTVGGAGSSTPSLLTALQQCLGQVQVQAEECASDQVRSSAQAEGVKATTRDLVLALQADERLGGICHSSLHELGAAVADDYLGSIADLRPLLPACAFGLLHGIMDHAELPGEPGPAAQAIFDVCDTLVGAGSDEGGLLRFDCAHGSGHALMRTRPGDTAYGYQACRQAFPQARFRGECFNGVAMRNLDHAREVLKTRERAGTTVPARVFDDLARVCQGMGELMATHCAPVLVQPSVEAGTDVTRSFLDWCAQTWPRAARTCWSSTGAAISVIAASIGKDADAVAQLAAQACGRSGGDLVDECWRALAGGLTQRGLGNDRAWQEACQQYRVWLGEDRAQRLCQQVRTLVAESVLQPSPA